jgi:hypothetical protein
MVVTAFFTIRGSSARLHTDASCLGVGPPILRFRGNSFSARQRAREQHYGRTQRRAHAFSERTYRYNYECTTALVVYLRIACCKKKKSESRMIIAPPQTDQKLRSRREAKTLEHREQDANVCMGWCTLLGRRGEDAMTCRITAGARETE